MRILVADNNDKSRKILADELRKYNHAVLTCSDGHTALRLLQGKNPPDIALLDWKTPNLTGAEVCKQFKNGDDHDSVYLILLIAQNTREDIVTSLSSGADDYITRPIQFDDLESRLILAEKHLRLNRQMKERENKAHSLLSRLTGLISNLHHAVLVEDEYRKIVFANDSFCRLFEIPISPDALIGRDYIQLAMQSKSILLNEDQFLKLMNLAITNQKALSNQEIQFAQNRYFEVDYVPTFLGEKCAGHLWIYRDVTDKKRFEENLKNARNLAESATQSKSAFLANMSHEIRTPMNGIIGMCNLLLSSQHNREQADRLRTIQRCGNTLLDIINDILDYSKLEAGKIELENEPFSLNSALTDVVDLLKSKVNEQKVPIISSFDADVPAWIRGDVTRLKQVLINLIGNAIKFTEQGQIQITVKKQKIDDTKVTLLFSVKDSGLGISQNVQNRLFKPFSQTDLSTTRNYGGSGLGLFICKSLCTLMGGDIWVESELNQGSTFTFSMVAEVTEALALDEETNPFSPFDPEMGKKHPLRIMIAEDNRINQLVSVGLLEKLGYSADVAADGNEVLDNLQRQSYDIIFMDCRMPEMDGFEATQIIRNRYRGASRPLIVALTASTTKEDIDRCFQSGMDSFIGKPISIPSLVKVLSGHNKKIINLDPNPELTPEKKTSPSLDPLDRQAFANNFRGMEDIAQESIECFLSGLPKMISSIEKAIQMKNPQDLEVAAHSLKGAISNFYAEPSKQLAWQLEQLGAEGHVEGGNNLLAQLKIEISKLQPALRSLVSSQKAG